MHNMHKGDQWIKIVDPTSQKTGGIQRPGTGHVCLKGWGGSPAKIEHFPKVPNTLRGWVPHGKMHRR